MKQHTKRTAVLMVAFMLAWTVTALAAAPKKGATYRGTASRGEKVVLKVSSNGKKVSFTESCQGSSLPTTVSNMALSRSGTFSGKMTVASVPVAILSVKGQFVSAKKAKGTYTTVPCSSAAGTWVATTH